MIRQRENVILQDNRGGLKLVTLHPSKTITWRKHKIPAHSLIATPFGTPYMLHQGQLQAIPPRTFYDKIDSDHTDIEAKDNRNIFSDGGAQRLEHEEIEELKRERDGEEMVSLIAQSNCKFEQRTAYSKQKYLKRKKAKYLFYLIAKEVTPHSLAHFYFQNQPKKTSYLRPDMLALLLLYASFKPHSSILIIDKTSLLLTASMAKRTAGMCKITVLKEESKSMPFKGSLLSEMNLSQEEREAIKAATFEEIKHQQFTHIVMAGDFRHASALQHMFELLVQGGRVLAYSQYMELLGECFDFMMGQRRCVSVQMMDSFSRVMQVLNNRTHPMMSMNQFSGYMLWGIKGPFKVSQPLAQSPAQSQPEALQSERE